MLSLPVLSLPLAVALMPLPAVAIVVGDLLRGRNIDHELQSVAE